MAELPELPEKKSIVGNFTQSMLDSVAIQKLQPFISCFLPPANEVCEGYVFTGVGLSTGRSGLGGGGRCLLWRVPA